MKIEQKNSDKYTISLSKYEMELLQQVILSGIDNLMKGQYELKKSIQNDMDLNSLKKISVAIIRTSRAGNCGSYFIRYHRAGIRIKPKYLG